MIPEIYPIFISFLLPDLSGNRIGLAAMAAAEDALNVCTNFLCVYTVIKMSIIKI
jgi:hypothetical protein